MGNGTFQNVSGEKGHGKRDILPSWNDFILWESDHLSTGNRNTYPLGIGLLILWVRDILWDTEHRKRDTLSSGIRTTYPLGIGNLGDEVQPFNYSSSEIFILDNTRQFNVVATPVE